MSPGEFAADVTPTSRLKRSTLTVDLGLLAAVVSAAAFGSSGPFAKSLLVTGWAPPTIVTLRIGIAALVLLGPALWWRITGGRPGAAAASPAVAVRWAGAALALASAWALGHGLWMRVVAWCLA